MKVIVHTQGKTVRIYPVLFKICKWIFWLWTVDGVFQHDLGVKILKHRTDKLSALSYAWSSNLLDYLTTLALIQSNNGEPNWGPNHATKHTVELLNRCGPTPPSYITLLMAQNAGWLQKRAMCSSSNSYLSLQIRSTCWGNFFFFFFKKRLQKLIFHFLLLL